MILTSTARFAHMRLLGDGRADVVLTIGGREVTFTTDHGNARQWAGAPDAVLAVTVMPIDTIPEVKP